jgi:phosphoesterase RecJ-like protein
MVKAGRLLRFGFDHARIIREVFFEKTFLQHKLMGIGLGQARLYLDGLLIVSEIDYDTMQANHACKNDLEGIASEMVLTEGVDCALFLHGSGPDESRVSLRSNTIVDVARIARMFDGGGHVRASGCTIHGDSSPALEKMIEAAREQLREAGRL